MAARQFRRIVGNEYPHELHKYAGRIEKQVDFVKITPRVREFLDLHNSPNGVELARNLAEEISRFRAVEVPLDIMQSLYLQRTADEILESKTVFVLGDKDARKKAVGGCTEYAIALIACLRAAGYKPRFVRRSDHTFVKVKLKDEDGIMRPYYVDPSRRRGQVVRINRGLLEQFREERKNGTYAEGPTPASIGMHSLKDFNRYVKP